MSSGSACVAAGRFGMTRAPATTCTLGGGAPDTSHRKRWQGPLFVPAAERGRRGDEPHVARLDSEPVQDAPDEQRHLRGT